MLVHPTTYDLNELADAAGVTTRTIRYYVAQGLLPSPTTRGPGTRYDQGHLDRLQLIRRLQRQHLPLAEIRRQLEALDDAGVREVLRSAPEPPKHSTALAYVRGLLSKEVDLEPAPQPSPPSAASKLAESLPLFGKSEGALAHPQQLHPSPLPPPRPPRRSTWDRVALSPDVELHVRRPLTREQNRQVEQLMDAVRHIFTKEE